MSQLGSTHWDAAFAAEVMRPDPPDGLDRRRRTARPVDAGSDEKLERIRRAGAELQAQIAAEYERIARSGL